MGQPLDNRLKTIFNKSMPPDGNTEETSPAPVPVPTPEPAPPTGPEPIQAQAREMAKEGADYADRLLAKAKNEAAKGLDKVLDKLTDLGCPLLKLISGGSSFIAELFGPATMWLPKVSLVAAGYGLDKLGRRMMEKYPASKGAQRVGRLARAIGGPAYKGGALGGMANMLINTVLPPGYDKSLPAVEAAAKDSYHFVDGIINGATSLNQQLVDIKTPVEGWVTANLGTEAGQQVNPAIDAVSSTIGTVGQELGTAGPQLGEMGKKALEVGGSIGDFLRTPFGRVAGAVGLGGLAYSFLKKIGFYKGPPAPSVA